MNAASGHLADPTTGLTDLPTTGYLIDLLTSR